MVAIIFVLDVEEEVFVLDEVVTSSVLQEFIKISKDLCFGHD